MVKKEPSPSTTTRRTDLSETLGKIRGTLSKPRKKQKRMCLILNPAAGQQNPDLKTINKIFSRADFLWEIKITNKLGDGARLARKAVAQGVELVAVYGGDGTVMDVASGLTNTDTPLAILPGGTGNALAIELGVPRILHDACAMVVDKGRHEIRTIDVGKINNHDFLLRVGIGFEALVVQTADRNLKDRFGVMAYVIGMVGALGNSTISKYHLTLDGQVVETDGLACMIANAGTIGVPGITLNPKTCINDGLLDVFIIRKNDLSAVFSVAVSLAGAPPPTADVLHYQCQKLTLTADPPQGVEADGDFISNTPVEASIQPLALKVIVPKV